VAGYRLKVLITRAFVIGILSVLLGAPSVAETIPLRQRGGGYLIRAQLNGAVSLDFILDTGASDVAIPGEVAEALMRAGTLTANDFLGTQTYILADGSRVPSKRFVLREIKVGDQIVRGVTASVGPARSPPLLGQSFLSKFPSWTLDNERHVITLASSAEPSLPDRTKEASDSATASRAFGSVSRDQSTGRYGFSWNQGSQSQADSAAIRGCSTDRCEVAFRVGPRQCGALAMTESGQIWGGATRDVRADAESAAMQNCAQRTSEQCKLRGSICNR
jgi:clan AA aspartic protease (TIGR02281 family)